MKDTIYVNRYNKPMILQTWIAMFDSAASLLRGIVGALNNVCYYHQCGRAED